MLPHELVVLILISAVGGVEKGSRFPVKGFYCKDPDTGKMYPVNTTWTSTTFCGSYTCRIKKKDNDGNQVSLELSINKTKIDVESSRKIDERIHEDTVSKELLGNWTTLLEKNTKKSKGRKQVDLFANDISYKDDEVNAENIEGDRLLSEKEVKALTLLLKTIKLSELDAILQVFHLAHDLYAEVDKVIEGAGDSSEQKIPDATGLKSEVENKGGHIVSYWYEPLTIMNNKVRADAKIFINKGNNKKKNNMGPKMSTLEPKKGVIVKLNPVKLESKDDVFSTLLTTDSVKETVNYHPLIDFQRQSSDTRTSKQISNSLSASILSPQIAKPNDRPVIPLPKVVAFPASYQAPFTAQENKKKTDKCGGKNGEVTLLSKKLNVLPWFATKGDSYNFKRAEIISLPRRNRPQSLRIPLDYIAAIAKGANPLSFLTIAKSGKNIQQVPVAAADVARHPGNILLEEEINAPARVQTDAGPLLDPARNSMDNLMPGWSAGFVGVPVFNDVRSPDEAIYSGTLLPFPFKKNGNEKLLKLPHAGENKRQKRDLNDQFNRDDFEVYLEKSTCATDIEPGFFRMGDPTKPFPECCPQRIQGKVPKKLHT